MRQVSIAAPAAYSKSEGGIALSEPEQPSNDVSRPDAAQRQADAEPPSAEQQPSPVPATAAPAARRTPIGKPRGVVFVILISILTFGIYHLYWVYKVFEEMKQHTQTGIGGVLGLVIALVINPVIWFVMPSEIGQLYRGDRRSAPLSGWTGLWMLLPIVGWFVWMVKVQRALNGYWQSKETIT
ncbi:MAG TPA: DUF4234 domain-containing protein [Gaiellaceae bacterium]|jgi:hypothetical protein